jgi:hypothetical protein
MERGAAQVHLVGDLIVSVNSMRDSVGYWILRSYPNQIILRESCVVLGPLIGLIQLNAYSRRGLGFASLSMSETTFKPRAVYKTIARAASLRLRSYSYGPAPSD